MAAVIQVADQISLHREAGFLWSGWMGGQWAMTPEILSWIKGDDLVVLCGGPGDLAINARLARRVRRATSVDVSPWAIAYGMTILDLIRGGRKQEMFLGDTVWGEAVSSVNRRVGPELVPPELIEPFVGPPQYEVFDSAHTPALSLERAAAMFVDGSAPELVQADALAYVRSRQDWWPGTTWYIASPTSFPDPRPAVGQRMFQFFRLYDDLGLVSDEAMRAWLCHEDVHWGQSGWEMAYLGELVRVIATLDPTGRVLFGVGSGVISCEAYREVIQDHTGWQAEVVLTKRFRSGSSEFVDNLIVAEV